MHRNSWQGIVALAALAFAACQSGGARHAAPPRACDLAGFGEAPGIELPASEAAARNQQVGKSAPLQFARGIPVNKTPSGAGKWSDAAPGWKAWRVWLRSEEARSVAVHLKPLSLPPDAELWICSPDGTTRQGPHRGQGPNQAGELWSPTVPGPELWLEVLVPADAQRDVELTVVTAFAGFR